MKRAFLFFAYSILCFVVLLSFFEFLYRFQVVDTYLPELRAYNSEERLKNSEKKTILIMGDSFTAGQASYPNIIQKILLNYRVINSGLPGTGIIQASIIAPKRFKIFNPSIFIYQVYAGNDLFDITYSANWKEISFLRNLYWTISNHLRSLSFLNYRLGQMRFGKANKSMENSKKIKQQDSDDIFSVERYTKREKIYIKAEPMILENHIMIKGKRKKDFNVFIGKLEKLVSYCKPGECNSYVLVIPHACQVDERYLENMEFLGSIFHDPKQILNSEYPFIEKIREKFMKNENVQVLNTIQVLKDNERRNNRMYYQNDGHLNPEGLKTIAEFLLAQINFDDVAN